MATAEPVAAEKTNEAQPNVVAAVTEKATAQTEAKKPKATKNAVAKATPVEAAAEVATETGDSGTTAKTDKKRPARPRKAKTEAKPVDLAASGLQLVETKADAPQITVSAENEKPKAPRRSAAWQKQLNEDVTAEPLVMVETQNK